MAGATASSLLTAASSTSQTPSPDPPSSPAATCTPSLVLPHPPAPVKVTRRQDSTRPRTSDSSRSRPINVASWAGRLFGSTRAAAANAPGGLPYTAASTSPAGTRPRAADRNSSRAGPARPSAPASKTAVSLCALRWIPRSRSLTDRGLSPAASASSSCVIWASARSRRSSPANESAGCSAMAPMPLDPPAAPPRRGTRPFPKQYAPGHPCHPQPALAARPAAGPTAATTAVPLSAPTRVRAARRPSPRLAG
jgi:hypothetical protein